MTPPAQPYAFPAFDADDENDAPAPVAYSAADLEAAAEAARAEARAAAETAQAQARRAALADIADAARRAAEAAQADVAAHIEAISAVGAEAISACAGAVLREEAARLAKDFIHAYLGAHAQTAEARLAVPASLDDSIVADIETALAAGAGNASVSLIRDETLAPGDMRLSWRGGSMAVDQDALNAQIKTVIAGLAAARRASPGGTAS